MLSLYYIDTWRDAASNDGFLDTPGCATQALKQLSGVGYVIVVVAIRHVEDNEIQLPTFLGDVKRSSLKPQVGISLPALTYVGDHPISWCGIEGRERGLATMRRVVKLREAEVQDISPEDWTEPQSVTFARAQADLGIVNNLREILNDNRQTEDRREEDIEEPSSGSRSSYEHKTATLKRLRSGKISMPISLNGGLWNLKGVY
ncbi:hypothetical protein NUW58_g1808 [Xylaria curta]|uniref:Uncharacterized protein n=1 Tax=Xylaria curta TaxID=42375 RepID=A0ACC1PIN6_9PEZI|nr:hypothetical protein NUW58_g1808 [Xylaria curta]